MRIQTATSPPFCSRLPKSLRFGSLLRRSMSPSFLFAFLLAVLGALLGGLAVAGADFAPEHLAAGIEGAHLAKASEHLKAIPHAFLGHLPHEAANLVELVDELLDLMRLGATPRGNAAAAAEVDDVRVAPFLFG